MSNEYHKIQSMFKRDTKGKMLFGDWSWPEFEYLKDLEWIWDEKVDGTNIRVNWNQEIIRFGGRTERAQVPVKLLDALQDLFPASKFTTMPEMTLYGEGYGAKIQKGGGNYRQDNSFVLFDVFCGGYWLRRVDIEEIAKSLVIDVCPIVGKGTLTQARNYVEIGMKSTWGDFQAEGLVLRPPVQLFTRQGKRLITKTKVKDFSSQK